MTLKDLVGYRLVSVCDDHITVRNGDSEYVLKIEEDKGDCCGYNDIQSTLFITDEELSRNPIIVDVEQSNVDCGECEEGKLAIFGEYRPLAAIETESGSGSGWCYGACVWVECKELMINETLSSW